MKVVSVFNPRIAFTLIAVLLVVILLSLGEIGVGGIEVDSIMVVPVVVCLVGLLMLLIEFPSLALVLLLVLSHIQDSGTWIPVYGLNLKLEHIGSSVVLLSLVLGTILKRRKLTQAPSKTGTNTLILWGPLLWVVFTAISSFESPIPGKSLILSFQMSIAILPVIVLPRLINTTDEFTRAENLLIMTGGISLILGVIGWVLNAFWGYPTVLSHSQLLEAGTRDAPKGLFNETNIYADYGLSTIGLVLPKLRTLNNRKYWVILWVGAIGLVLSQTRIAWLATPIVVILYVIMELRASEKGLPEAPRGLTRLLLFFSVAAVVTLLALAIMIARSPNNVGAIGASLLNRLHSLHDLDYEFNFITRLQIIQLALESYLRESSILFGLGADSFRMTYTVVGGSGDWIHNTYIAALHDGGILGSSCLFLGWGFLMIHSWGSMRKAQYETRISIEGLWLGAWALILTGNSNNLSWMTLYWVYYGLLAAGVRLEDTRLRKIQFQKRTGSL